jgi:hypothetical protein
MHKGGRIMISIQKGLRFGDHIGLVCENRRSGTLETNRMKEWNMLLKRVHAFFTNEYQSTWEKMTGTLWQEWAK